MTTILIENLREALSRNQFDLSFSNSLAGLLFIDYPEIQIRQSGIPCEIQLIQIFNDEFRKVVVDPVILG